MVKKTVYSICCFLFLFILSTSASAQVKPLTFYASPYFGGFVFDHDQKLNNMPVYGIRFGYDITKYFGVEVSGEYIYTKYDVDLSESRRSHVLGTRVDAVLNLLPNNRFVPFIFAGIGGQHIDYPRGIENKAALTADYGVGLKYYLKDWIALRADVQQIYVFDNSKKDFEYTMGVVFYFGGRKAATSPAKSESKYEPASEIKSEPQDEKVIILASEPEAEEQLAVVASEPKEKVIILAFEDVHFDFDKSTLRPEAQTLLKRNIQLLKDNPKAKIRIAGYTSASGTHAYNQKLSERRAKAVREYLINEGVITPDRLSIIGYGETHPAMYEAAPKELYSKAAKANMRVLFEIVVK